MHEPGLIRSLAARQIGEEARSLRAAEHYVVSPAMHAVVAAAAETVEQKDLVTLVSEDDIPARHGFVLLPGVQLVNRGGDPDRPSDVLALSWSVTTITTTVDGAAARVLKATSWVAADGPMQYPDFVAARRYAKEQGHPFPGLIPDARCQVRIDHEHRLSEAEMDLILAAGRDVRSEAAHDLEEADGQLVGEYTGASMTDTAGNFRVAVSVCVHAVDGAADCCDRTQRFA